MSSAIEVLKEMLERNLESAEYQKAVEEGILALEQKEKYGEFIDKATSTDELLASIKLIKLKEELGLLQKRIAFLQEQKEKLKHDAKVGFDYMQHQSKTCPNKEYAKGSRDVWETVLGELK